MTKDLEALIRRNELAQERFKDLEEYFGGSKSILEDRKEFKKWLERGEQAIEKVDEMESKLEQPTTQEITSDDCVSRKRIKQIVSNITAEYDTETIHIDRLMDEIDDLPPVTPTQSWIPLVWDEYPTVDIDGNDDYVYAVDYSVPMPNEDEWVLITDENLNVRVVQYDGYDFGDYVREEILAWKHLPNPYIE